MKICLQKRQHHKQQVRRWWIANTFFRSSPQIRTATVFRVVKNINLRKNKHNLFQFRALLLSEWTANVVFRDCLSQMAAGWEFRFRWGSWCQPRRSRRFDGIEISIAIHLQSKRGFGGGGKEADYCSSLDRSKRRSPGRFGCSDDVCALRDWMLYFVQGW